MVEIKTEKYTVRIHDGKRFKATSIEIPKDAAARFAREIIKQKPDYFEGGS